MRRFSFLLLLLSILLFVSCSEINNELCIEEPQYRILDFNGIDVYSNIDDGIVCSSESKKPLFVIFTGYGCVSTRESYTFEGNLFESRRFRKMVTDNFIPVVLYVDDRTKLDNEIMVKRNGQERKLRNIGSLYSEYQIVKFKQNSQPLLAILDHDGDQIINTMGYVPDFDEYYYFLKEGLEEYQKIGD